MFQNVVKYTYKTSLMTCSCLCAASFAAQASEMQCLNVNCESLGYTKVTDLENTSCKSFLTCPYDPSYIKCDLLPTCENLGFTNDDKSDWCTNLVRCPTDPSYTLCKSLCGECPEGTALDPAELGCEGAYEAAYIKRIPRGGRPKKIYITNDCGYTCYKCSECDDEEYDEAEELCSAGTYITEVIHPKCPSNAGKGDRYICSDCPDGLINLGENNYDCTVLDDEGNPVAGCDGINFFNSLAECQSAKGECAEHPTAFGICYASSAICGEGALSSYKYSFEGQPPSLEGHEWIAKTDSTGKVCYKTTCHDYATPSTEFAFGTLRGCQGNYASSGTPLYAVKCKDDGYSCYVFDKCADGYVERREGDSVSCMCDATLYPYTENVSTLPSYTEVDYDSELCEDRQGDHYEKFKCMDDYQFENGKCVCEDRFKYTNANVPTYGSVSGEYCSDSTSTRYTTFACDKNHRKVGNKCMCPTNYRYTDSNVPDDSHTAGSSCTDSDGKKWYTKFECDEGYLWNDYGSGSCHAATCTDLNLYDEQDADSPTLNCRYELTTVDGDNCYSCSPATDPSPSPSPGGPDYDYGRDWDCDCD